jgi:Spy/CpxP family protein refolding chaperone
MSRCIRLALIGILIIAPAISSTPLNPVEAQQVSQQISEIAAQRMVNRPELHNQIFQVLDLEQRQQYMQMVRQSLEDLE